MVEAGIAAGLDALVFTDHDQLVPRERLSILNAKYASFRVFGGIEVSVEEGEHVLVLGVQAPSLEIRGWTYPNLHTFVRERGGFLVLNHPFRYTQSLRVDITRHTPDAIELYSHNTPVDAETRIRRLASDLGMRVLSNSDAHQADRLGAYYTRLTTEPLDDDDLVAALRSGHYCCYAPRQTPTPGWVDTALAHLGEGARSPSPCPGRP